MSYYFSSESVSGGHPDKVSDQIADALLDEFLRRDPDAKVACEVLCTTGLVVVSGEVRTRGYVDVQQTVRDLVNKLGYNRAALRFDGNSCGVISALHGQSPDIYRGVQREDPLDQGAGDQGMMFGYATSETDTLMPLPHLINNLLLFTLKEIREAGEVMGYLRPDAKCQVTMLHDDQGRPQKLHTLLVSLQHDDFAGDDAERMQKQIAQDLRRYVIPKVRESLTQENRRVIGEDYNLLVNPTGKFVIGGPHGDTGLTGRKIIVDTYGGYAPHGGGAFSGKDASKVDRSASYAMRHLAKNIVAAKLAERVTTQVAYAIGVAKPLSLMVNTHGTSRLKISDGELALRLNEMYDLRPAALVERFNMRYPIYLPTAAYGHFGRDSYTATVRLDYPEELGGTHSKQVRFFPWEDTDIAESLQSAFL